MPLRIPAASSRAAVITVTEDFPFVPTTCRDANRPWGSPSASHSARIRSSPKRQPTGSRPAR